jgi:hypothetical protein
MHRFGHRFYLWFKCVNKIDSILRGRITAVEWVYIKSATDWRINRKMHNMLNMTLSRIRTLDDDQDSS